MKQCPICLSDQYIQIAFKDFYYILKSTCNQICYAVKCIYCSDAYGYFGLIKPQWNISLQCQQCKQRISYAKCPYFQCGAILLKQQQYKFGQNTQCYQCGLIFKQIPCVCGVLNNLEARDEFEELLNEIQCYNCKKVFNILNCRQCHHLNYFKNCPNNLDIIRCNNCRIQNQIIECLRCKYVQKNKRISIGQNYECGNCKYRYRYEKCGYCQYVYMDNNNVYKKCEYLYCKKQYIRKDCQFCSSSIIFKNIKRQSQISTYCIICDQKSIFNQNQFYSEKQNSKSSNIDNCVICLENPTNVIHQTCKHRSICQKCYKDFQIRGLNKNRCPICRAEGQFTLAYNK